MTLTPAQSLPAVLDKIDADLDQSLERLFEFLRIQSISTDPAYQDQCRSAAEYVAKDLSNIGFDTSIRPTGGHPIIVGKGGPRGKAPHVLFYGHYDVQPVDPLDLWEAPPFAPRIATLPDGRKISRGMSGVCGRHRPITAPHHHDDRGRGGVRLEAPIRLRQR